MTNTNDKHIIGNHKRNTIGDAHDNPDCNEILNWDSTKTAKKTTVTSSVSSVSVNGTADDLTSPMDVTDPEKYLILPARTHGSYEYPDMLVSTDRYHFGNNWNGVHKLLARDGNCMITIRQFVDFLNLLKSGSAYNGKGNKVSKAKLDGLFNEIVDARDPFRAEFFDARFESENIVYRVIKGSNIVEIKEPLNDYLNYSKAPGISLDSWISDANHHGLPKKNVCEGDICYYEPNNGRVAGFGADSDKAFLSCGGDLEYTNISVGVRIARPFDGVK